MKPSAVGKAIVGVCRALSEEGIAKSHQNQDDGYSFRSVDDVYRALSPLLVEHGLVILPSVLERKVTVRPAQGGRAVSCVSLAVKYTIVSANDGSKFEVVVHGEAMDASDKGTNKAMQAAYKYMAFQTFCIPVAGEEDADSVTLELAPDESSQRSRPRRSAC